MSTDTTTEARLQYHPLSNYLPKMGDEEFAQLVKSIEDNGLREPITLYEGMILDGRNRYEACLEAKVEPTTEEWDGVGDPLDYVRDRNLRRHMTQAQKREVVIGLLNDHSHRSDRWIASWAGVSHNTVASIRERMVGGGQIDHHEKRVGKNEVEQPAAKSQREEVEEAQPPPREEAPTPTQARSESPPQEAPPPLPEPTSELVFEHRVGSLGEDRVMEEVNIGPLLDRLTQEVKRVNDNKLVLKDFVGVAERGRELGRELRRYQERIKEQPA